MVGLAHRLGFLFKDWLVIVVHLSPKDILHAGKQADGFHVGNTFLNISGCSLEWGHGHSGVRSPKSSRSGETEAQILKDKHLGGGRWVWHEVRGQRKGDYADL